MKILINKNHMADIIDVKTNYIVQISCNNSE